MQLPPWSVERVALLGVVVVFLSVYFGRIVRQGCRQALRQPAPASPGISLLGGVVLAVLMGALTVGVYKFVFYTADAVTITIAAVMLGLSPLLNAIGYEFGYARARRSRATEAHPEGETGQPLAS